MENPFKLIEPHADCPPHLKEQIVSEIDLIRNALNVVELYSGDLFGSLSALLSPQSDSQNPTA
ncbi:hypothetical protein F7231_15215 [Fibrella aestuarina]|uniref:Uncharacterized protein n=1 Tax=Fibrivirga algicola TaxID=2950420 RepID=A0ABX0QLN7_9BACT|nr:hypothetical protein [Fibrivirga algicola]